MIFSKIKSTGSYLPDTVLDNAQLSEMVDTSDEWILKRVGIRERRIIGDSSDTTDSMALAAAQLALSRASLTPNDIELVIVGTVTSTHTFPSAACFVQQGLGITNQCPAFDVSAACSGFIYAMSVADQYIRSGAVRRAMVIGVESLSKIVDWQDRSTCVLFGDGAGAVVLEASESPGVIKTCLHADGHYTSMLHAKSQIWSPSETGVPPLVMDGREVFKLAVAKLEEIVDQTLEQAGIAKEAVDWLIPHQANMRIIQATAKRLGLPMSQVILTIEHHGNTSAASVPLALDHAVTSGKIQRGDMVMLEAFGGGFAWGSALLTF